MGYNVRTLPSSKPPIISRDKFDELYQELMLMDDPMYDAYKHGFENFGGKIRRFYSWMNDLYQCKNLHEVVYLLGFVSDLTQEGDLVITHYDSKMGQEKLFFAVMAKYIPDGCYLDWVGEDGDTYQWQFKGGKLYAYECGIANTVSTVFEWYERDHLLKEEEGNG